MVNTEAKQVFEVFDKKYEGKVDAHYIGDMLRALNLAPTNAECEKRGQTPKTGKRKKHTHTHLRIIFLIACNTKLKTKRYQTNHCRRISSHLLGVLQNARKDLWYVRRLHGGSQTLRQRIKWSTITSRIESSIGRHGRKDNH